MLQCTLMRVGGKHWGKCHFIQSYVSRVEVVWNFMVCIDVFPRFRVRGNITVYSDVCLIYWVREMFLCTVMCTWGTVWGICFCLHWCGSEVQGEGKFNVYTAVGFSYRVIKLLLCTKIYLSYRVKEILLCTLKCVWFTGWVNCCFVQWCVCKEYGEGNGTVYNDVFLRYRMRELLLCTVKCVWGFVSDLLLCIVVYVCGTMWGNSTCVH